MPYAAEHKPRTRARIIESARVLFNRHSFSDVSIDEIMAMAGLTRGGFYSHFRNKPALYAAAVDSFLHGRGAQWREESGVTESVHGTAMARQMIHGYLSKAHLADCDGQCPIIALPSDIARENPAVQTSYQNLFQAMVGLFENSLEGAGTHARRDALSLAALCVGGMVLARTLADPVQSREVGARRNWHFLYESDGRFHQAATALARLCHRAPAGPCTGLAD